MRSYNNASGQCRDRNYGFSARPIGNNKVKLREELNLVNLVLIQLFYYYKSLEVFIVYNNLKWLLSFL